GEPRRRGCESCLRAAPPACVRHLPCRPPPAESRLHGVRPLTYGPRVSEQMVPLTHKSPVSGEIRLLTYKSPVSEQQAVDRAGLPLGVRDGEGKAEILPQSLHEPAAPHPPLV